MNSRQRRVRRVRRGGLGNVGGSQAHAGVDCFTRRADRQRPAARARLEYNSFTTRRVAGERDANKAAAGDARAIIFELASPEQLDSSELSKTISADVDRTPPRAPSPESRSGRSRARAAVAFIPMSRLRRRESSQPQLRPTTNATTTAPERSFDYSDLFLVAGSHRALAIDSNMYTENARTVTATAPRRRPPIRGRSCDLVQYTQSPRINRRTSVRSRPNSGAPNLVLSLGLISNYSYLYTPARRAVFRGRARGRRG